VADPTPIGITKSEKARIVPLVQWFEQRKAPPGKLQTRGPGAAPPEGDFLGWIVVGTFSAGAYAWKWVTRDGSGWVEGGHGSDTYGTAVEAEGSTTATGQHVPLFRVDLDGGGAVLVFPQNVRGGVFAVTLTSDGGGDGGSTAGTKPTWTYTVKDINTGVTLIKTSGGTAATGMSPLASSRLPAKAAAATAGTAYYKSDGTLVLQQAFEDYAYCTDE
jgi:hypothetical protein